MVDSDCTTQAGTSNSNLQRGNQTSNALTSTATSVNKPEPKKNIK